jgi:3-deoxy-7-phosphoheptulonate synthase
MAHQPDPEKEPDLQEGLIAMRRMHLRAIAESGLTAADEMLYPENWPFVEDILSYVAVGARSVENQQHRLTISGMDIPAGMKNPTSGDFTVMLNSVVASQTSHTFLYRKWEVNTTGNPLSHTIIRGAVNKHGQSIPNYHYEDLVRLLDMYQERDLQNPATLVDANHANSNKNYSEQVRIVKEVLHSRRISTDIAKLVKGVMIESYIEPGSQEVSGHVYGKSITDPCLGWEESEKLIYTIADQIQ